MRRHSEHRWPKSGGILESAEKYAHWQCFLRGPLGKYRQKSGIYFAAI